MITKYLMYILSVFFVFVRCSNPEPANLPTTDTQPFFDVKGFVNTQIKENTPKVIEKTVVFNGASETQTLSDFDLKKELHLFVQSDINKPVWFDAYQTDTLQGEHGTIILKHSSLKEDLKTKSIEATLAGTRVKKIVIKNQSKTPIYNTDQVLIYEPNKGYSITNEQDTPLTKSKIYQIRGVFR